MSVQFTWPLDDWIITRDFYYLASLYVGGQHAALDLIRKTGTTRAAPTRAVADGTVAGVGWDMYSGFFVAVDHAGGFRSWYRHLYGQTPVVVSQQVSQGQIIGNVGNTGASQGDHLHFDLWNMSKIRDDDAIFFKNNWYAVDPTKYLGQEDTMALTAEQSRLLSNINHYVQIVIPGLFIGQETNNRARHAQLKAAIAAVGTGTGGGATPAQVKAAFKAAIRELVKAG